jgi:hypothetical protein
LSNHRLKLPDDLVFVHSPLDRILLPEYRSFR